MTTQVAPVQTPIERVTPLKPSVAMRLGQQKVPRQARGAYARLVKGRIAFVCAVGAAVVGQGGDPFDNEAINKVESVIRAKARTEKCPVCKTLNPSASHLNDDHRWSTDQIADWLEGLGL